MFYKSLFVICPFSFAITPTFQLNSFQQVRGKPLNFFLSRYLFYMKQNQIILLTWNIGTFSSFNQNVCCILKVRWLFPNQMFITHNAFQLLLTDEEAKCSIFYTTGVIVYINPVRGRGGRDRMVVGFTTTRNNQCISPLTLCVRIQLMEMCIRYI